MKTYLILVSGDSYYKDRIKRFSCPLVTTDMHNYAGIVGNYRGENVGNIKDVRKKFEKMAAENESEIHSNTFDDGDGCYFQIISKAEFERKYTKLKNCLM